MRALLATSLAVLLGGILVPAGAAASTDPVPDVINGVPFERYIQRHDHSLGSQISKVETARSPSRNDRAAPSGVPGLDVSSHQGEVDWAHWADAGKRFAYVKATEGTYYTNPRHTAQYSGAHEAGMLRGSYHFAVPGQSSGATQANYFVEHGGGWSSDGATLPGALDMEYNPYGETCYGLSKDEMAAWVRDFSDTYHARTGRYPVIYTSTSWWSQCVDGDFSATNALWVARYSANPGKLPQNWTYHTFWQYSSDPLDQNAFNASYEQLRTFAAG